MTVNRTAGAAEPRRFDALELASSGAALTGEVDMARRLRVADRLVRDAPAPVKWRIAGAHDGLGRPMLVVTIEAALPVVCQRCLQPFALAVDQRSELLLARDSAELKRLDAEALEVVLAADAIDALSLIEDEVLLTLPYAPRHAEAQCAAAAQQRGPARAVENSPFAPLAALKKGNLRKTKE